MKVDDKLDALMNDCVGAVIVKMARELIELCVYKVKPYLTDDDESEMNDLYNKMDELLVKIHNEILKEAINTKIEINKELTKNV